MRDEFVRLCDIITCGDIMPPYYEIVASGSKTKDIPERRVFLNVSTFVESGAYEAMRQLYQKGSKLFGVYQTTTQFKVEDGVIRIKPKCRVSQMIGHLPTEFVRDELSPAFLTLVTEEEVRR